MSLNVSSSFWYASSQLQKKKTIEYQCSKYNTQDGNTKKLLSYKKENARGHAP